MNYTSEDGVGLTKVGGGLGTRGDVAIQPDDGSTASPVASWAAWVPTFRTLFHIRDITVSSSGPFTTGTSGTGSSAAVIATGDTHPSAIQLSTGTTTTGRASRGYNPAVNFDTAGHVHRIDFKFRINTLSTGTDTYNLSAGAHDALSAIDAVDGVYIKIDSNTNVAFQCVSIANSVSTVTSSGITAVAGTWYRVVIVVTNVSTVDFYIAAEGSALPSTPTVTISSNIPTGTARATQAPAMGVLKSAGTNARTVDVAYQQYDHDRLAA